MDRISSDALTVNQPNSASPSDSAAAVVLPAFVENRPRRMLQALANGVPVIASAACGVEGLPGVITIPTGDALALSAALEQVMVLGAARPQHYRANPTSTPQQSLV